MRTPLALLLLLLGARVSAQEAPDGAPLRFESSELRELAGTWGEPFRAVMLLPGVGHVLSGTGYPVVRGAPPSATLFSLDGVRVPMLYHLAIGPAVVHPELIAGLDFHRGAAPARFGRDAGGTVELRLTPPRVEEARTVASLDLVNAGLFAQVPIASTGTELTMAGRFAYTPWLYATSRSDLVANAFDYQARVTQALGEGSLRLLAFGGSDTAGTRGEGFVGEVGAGFHRVDLRLSQPLGAGEAQAALTWGVDRLAFGGGGDISRVAVRLIERTFGARLAWSASLSEHAKLGVGADVERRLAATHQSSTLRPGDVTDPARPTVTTSVEQPVAGTTLAGAYAQLAWEQAVVSSERVSTAAALEQAHILNAAVTVRLGWGVTLGATLHYNTGAPEAGGLSSRTQREGVDPLLGGPRWVDEDRDRVARLPGFFRVNGR